MALKTLSTTYVCSYVLAVHASRINLGVAFLHGIQVICSCQRLIGYYDCSIENPVYVLNNVRRVQLIAIAGPSSSNGLFRLQEIVNTFDEKKYEEAPSVDLSKKNSDVIDLTKNITKSSEVVDLTKNVSAEIIDLENSMLNISLDSSSSNNQTSTSSSFANFSSPQCTSTPGIFSMEMNRNMNINRSRVYSTPERHFEYSIEYIQAPLDLSLPVPVQPIIAVNTVEENALPVTVNAVEENNVPRNIEGRNVQRTIEGSDASRAVNTVEGNNVSRNANIVEGRDEVRADVLNLNITPGSLDISMLDLLLNDYGPMDASIFNTIPDLEDFFK